MVEQIHEELQRHKRSSRSGWNEDKALEEWAMLCGMTAMDGYVFEFICNEMQLQKSHVSEWQKTLSSLISCMLREGMPMHILWKGMLKHGLQLPTYKDTCRQARNAEEALLAALNACARVTQQLSNVEWESETAFGEWVSRLQPQRSGGENTLAFDCFSYLNLSGCYLDLHDFYAANLQRANLEGADLQLANLQLANLQRANLVGANLERANLVGAYLVEANLREADLVKANLRGANLRGAKLENANLEEVKHIETADLSGANLKGTALEEWHKEKYKQK